MRNPLSKKIVEIQPSGIRKFFDVANEMKDAISLGVGEPDLIRRGEFVRKAFSLWKRDVHFIHPMQDSKN